jgi:cell division protein FtsQ
MRKDADDFRLPGDEDETEESPYLRQRKAVAVRKNRLSSRVRRIAFWALCVVLVLVPVGAGGLALARYILRSSRFQLNSPNDVEILGNLYVSREEILNVLGVTSSPLFPSELNVFSISLSGMEKRVESFPWVRSATVARAYPHRLLVSVSERVPIAFADLDGRIKLIDADGVILDKPEKGSFDFPVVEGLNGQMGAGERQLRVALFQQFEGQISGEIPGSGWIISEVDLGDPEDLQAMLVQGRQTILLHFGNQDFGARFKNFLTLLPMLEKNNTAINSIDLRYGNQVVVDPARNRKSAGAPSGSARGRE